MSKILKNKQYKRILELRFKNLQKIIIKENLKQYIKIMMIIWNQQKKIKPLNRGLEK